MIYDISLPITEAMPVWPGQHKPALTFVEHMADGAGATVTHVALSAHTGTHLDAPLHFIEGGAGVDQLDLEKLIGPCYVAHAHDAERITADLLDSLAIPQSTTRLLIRTRNSDLWAGDDDAFHEDFVALDNTAAEWVVRRGMVLVGVDYLSVAPFDNGTPTHVTLLSNGVIPVEGLNLSGIARGSYRLVCLPIKLKDRDGAPCRAVLIR